VNCPRLAIVGAGVIAEDHARAALFAGFELVAVSAREGSTRAIKFAARHSIAGVYSSASDLIKSKKWDALLVCSATESLTAFTDAAIESGRPALVEKPVALESKDLLPLLEQDTQNIIVGYNRRHYSSVLAAKDFFERSENVVISLEIPESVNADQSKTLLGFRSVLDNSVHMLDLLSYIAGPVVIKQVFPEPGKIRKTGSLLVGENSRGDLVTVKAVWNSPSNFSISLENGHERFLLSPIERGVIFRGLDVVEPSERNPIRTYSPNLVGEHNLSPIDESLKPGFGEQMVAFRSFIENGERPKTLASLQDGFDALVLAEKLLGK